MDQHAPDREEVEGGRYARSRNGDVVDLSRGRNARLPDWARTFSRDYGFPVTVLDTLDGLPASAFDRRRSQWMLEALFDSAWTTAAAEDDRAIAMGPMACTAA